MSGLTGKIDIRSKDLKITDETKKEQPSEILKKSIIAKKKFQSFSAFDCQEKIISRLKLLIFSIIKNFSYN